MRIQRESIDRFFDYDIHVETRTIFIGDPGKESPNEGVGPLMAEHVIKGIHLLQSANKDAIKVILNSFGGCWYSGLAIYDAIASCPCHVTMEVLGSAMSMGAVILQAADERVMYPNSTLMIHDGYETIEKVSPKTFEATGKQAKYACDQMYEIFAKKSSRPAHFWEKRCQSDYYLNAYQALELGLIDRIVQPVAAVN